MMLSETSGVVKLLGGSLLGTMLIGSVLAATGEIPLPTASEAHSGVEVAMLGVLGYMLREVREMRAKTKPESQSGESRPEWREKLMLRLEDMAFGLSEHRGEFAGLKSELHGRFDAIDGKFDGLDTRVKTLTQKLEKTT